MKRQTAFKIIAVTLGTLASLIIAEVGYRVYHYANFRDLKDIHPGNRVSVISPNEEKMLGQIIQLSNHEKIVYELIPASKYLFQKVLVETNAQGFRDKDYPATKSNKTCRIIGLGDSVMFGWGVNEADCYLTKLENELNKNDSISFEIINTAVPGYNTVMEVETLKRKFDLTQVDYVLVNFVGNDFDLPNFIRKKPDYFGIKKSFILQRFEDNDGMDKNLRGAPFNKTNRSYEQKNDKVPVEYHGLVGEESFMRAINTLAQLQEEFGFRVIVLSTDPAAGLPDFVRHSCESLAFNIIESQAFWNNYKNANPDAVWRLSPNDGHPSTIGHAVIASALEEKIKSQF